MYLSKGVSDEDDKAISDLFLQSLEKTQQDKAIDKVGGRISDSTWRQFMRILLDPNSEPLVCQEVRRLVEQYNLIDTNPEGFKKGMLFTFQLPGNLPGYYRAPLEPPDRKAFIDSHLVCLSFLRIPTEKGEEAIKRSLAEKSYAPLVDLVHCTKVQS